MHPAVLLAAWGLTAVGVVAVSLPAAPGTGAQETTTVEVGDIWFCAPGDSGCMAVDAGDVDITTTIDAGDTVTWGWVGSLFHTTTACSGSDFATCGASQGWDSGDRSSGTFSFTFTEAGTSYYRCEVHPSEMRGQINVLAAQPTMEPSPAASPQPTTQPSPQPTPKPSPTLTGSQPTAVPTGGGEPPSGGTSARWWALVAGGGLLVASATGVALRRRRR